MLGTISRVWQRPDSIVSSLRPIRRYWIFAGQAAGDDLLPTRLPDKVKKPKWTKPRKPHSKASARSFIEAEAAEITVNQAEQSSWHTTRARG
jgi:hypothetical protein